MRTDALPLDVLDLGIESFQRVRDRLDERRDRLLARREVAGRLRMDFAELRLCELEELIVVRAQRVGGQRGEGVPQRRVGAPCRSCDEPDRGGADDQPDEEIDEEIEDVHGTEY